jgi:hypothetical protein
VLPVGVGVTPNALVRVAQRCVGVAVDVLGVALDSDAVPAGETDAGADQGPGVLAVWA